MTKDENNAIIKLGYSCNNNCCFCHEANNKVNFSFEEIKNQILKAKEAGARLIILSGGEPTIRPDIHKIIVFTKENKLIPAVITNGRMFYYKKNVKKLKNAGLSLAYLSLCGASAEIHDYLTRVRGSFKQTIEGIKNLIKSNIRVVVRVVLNKVNLKYNREIIDLCFNLGVKEIEFAFVSPLGRANIFFKGLVPTLREVSKIIKDSVFYSRIRGLGAYIDGMPTCFMGKYNDAKERFGDNLVYKFVSAEKKSEEILKESHKTKPDKCKGCSRYKECKGVYKEYLKRNGDDEINPRKDILLINPPVYMIEGDRKDWVCSYAFPTGLLRVGAYLIDRGHKVRYIDCMHYEINKNKNKIVVYEKICRNEEEKKKKVYHFGKSYKEFEKELRQNGNPDEIYVTCTMSFNWEPAHKIIDICKEVYPNTKVKFGGIYPTLCSEHAKKSKADEVMVGGVKESNNYPPAYELLKTMPKEVTVQFVRGCPNNCSYCAFPIIEGHRLFFRPIKTVIEELKYFANYHGVKRFINIDSNILVNAKNYFEKILDILIQERMEIEIGLVGGLQPNLLYKSLAEKLGRSQVCQVLVSLESYDEEVCKKRFHRSSTMHDFLRCIMWLKEAGFKDSMLSVNIMIGMPNQKLDSMLRTLIFLWALNVKIDVSGFTPVPRTEEYNKVYEKIKNKDLLDLHPSLWPVALEEIKIEELEFLGERGIELNLNNAEYEVEKSNLPRLKDKFYKRVEEVSKRFPKLDYSIKKNKKKVLLINPQIYLRGNNRDITYTHPTGLLRIGSYLMGKKYDVELIDCMYYDEVSKHNLTEVGEEKCGNYQNEELKKKVYLFGKSYGEFREELESKGEPDEIYVTCCLTFNWEPAHKIIEICKEVYPNTKVKFGGVYPTLCPEHAKKSKADEIVVGYYEEAHKSPPAYELMGKSPDYAIIELVRGCPNHCRYCAQKHIDPEVQFKDIKDIINEIKARIKEYDIKNFVILDPNVNQNPGYFKKFFDAVIENNLKINIKIPAGFQHNKIDLDLAKKMKSAGVKTINLSLESINPSLLEKFERYGTEKTKFEETIQTLVESGYKKDDIKIFVMACAPGQDITSVIDTIIFILSIGCCFDVSTYTPVPKTAMYNENIEYIKTKGLGELAPQLVPFATNDFRVSDIEFLKNMIKERKVNSIIAKAKEKNNRLYKIFSERIKVKGQHLITKGCAF